MQVNQPDPMQSVKTFATMAVVASLVVIVALFGFFGLVALVFGWEGARIVLVIALLAGLVWGYDHITARNRRDAAALANESFRIAVQGIIQHQSADDRGEIARGIVPLAIKTLMENQRSGQDIAKQIMQHGRFLAVEESKQAKAKPVEFPFEMNAEEDMEELI